MTDTTRRQSLQRFLAIALLANMAIAQPLYSKLGPKAEFFVSQGMDRSDLLLLVLLLSLVIPGLLALLPPLAGLLNRRLGGLVFGTLFVVLGALTAAPAVAALDFQGWPALTITAAIALAAAWLYRRAAVVRTFFSYLSPAIVVFAVAFLFFSRAAGIVLPASAAGGSERVQPVVQEDIVFLVLDEFPLVSLLTPELDIDRRRYPNFARLADTAHWFPGANSGAEGTVVAVPSALTGLAPADIEGQLPLVSNFPDNLFTRFRHSHVIRAVETATRLCPEAACARPGAMEPESSLPDDLLIVWRHIVTPRPWSERLPSLSGAWSGFALEGRAERVTDRPPGLQKALAIADWSKQMDWSRRTQLFREFTKAIRPSARPQLHYLHALLPHAPWNHLPDGRQYAFGETRLAPGLELDADSVWRWSPDHWYAEQAWQRHLLQTQYLDSLLGRLLDRLESQARVDHTLLVVMGDHGTSFIPGEPRREVTHKTLSDITGVPLFIRLPGQREGVRHTGDARLADVLPTVLDGLGLAYGGRSLLRPDMGPANRRIDVYGRAGRVFSYSFEEHMAHLRGRAVRKAELFGSGDPASMFRLGMANSLHGRAAPENAPLADGVEVVFAGRNLYQDVDPAGAFVPRLVRGTVRGLAPRDKPVVAIGVNGIVQATTRVSGGNFAAVLGPAALRAGANALDAYFVHDPGSAPQFTRLRQDPAEDYRINTAGGAVRIESMEGSAFPLLAGPAGRVNSVPAEGSSLFYLSGAVEPGQDLPDRVLVFAGSALAATGRVDPATRTFTITVTPGGSPQDAPVRVFGLLENARMAREFTLQDACSRTASWTPPATAGAFDCAAPAVSPLVQTEGGWHGLLEFGEAGIAPLLGEGWGHADRRIRWTLGKSAYLRIPLPAGIGELIFTANIKPYLAPPALPEQEVWLLANGRPVQSWVLADNRFGEIHWSVDRSILDLDPEALDLRFVTPNARAPRALGTGADQRELGLAFISLSITGSRLGDE